MSRVAVVTDTTQYLPREVIARHGLHLVSLYVNWDGRTDREADLPDFDAFYDYLRSAASCRARRSRRWATSWRSTSRCSRPGTTSSRSTCPAASRGRAARPSRRATQLIERGVAAERIVVMDSETACGGHGLMAHRAANARAGRGAGRGAAAAARELRRDLKLWFAVDTLEFLRRGGRIGAAQAWIGSALKIKPILTIEREITPIERVRTAGRAFERLVDFLQERRDGGADVFFLQHIQAADVVERLAERGAEIYGRPPEFVSEIGPVIGAHVGPGADRRHRAAEPLLGPV